MRRGGIFDHLGFGFHRYSTDPKWLVPHFEKMLYDQAMLLMAYTEAFEITGKNIFAETGREIATYVLESLLAPEGGFYSAEDADSEGVEGKFYLWSEEEIRGILDSESAELAIAHFSIERMGNYEEESSGLRDGSNILHLNNSEPSAISKDTVNSIREKLLAYRNRRIRPLLDDKILIDWNGLMIAALAKAGRVFDDTEYVEAAENAFEFIRENMMQKDMRLLRRYRNGKVGLQGLLNDYASLTFGLLELYITTSCIYYLRVAEKIAGLTIDLFEDRKSGGFFETALDGETILVRIKDLYDGALPSGNSIAFYNFKRLAGITGEKHFEKSASAAKKIMGALVETGAAGYGMYLAALVSDDSTESITSPIRRSTVVAKKQIDN